ncbi:MAG: helix-turn-helix domain-containing protein [Bacteroidota bacterium]|jgi:hypothetical protein
MTEKKPFGRPTKYKEEFCEKVMMLGKQGYSKAMIASTLDISRETLDQWIDSKQDFSDAMKRALTHAQFWWEKTAQENLGNNQFNSPLWSKSMPARFPKDYSDRSKVELTGANGGAVEVITKIENVIVDGKNASDSNA